MDPNKTPFEGAAKERFALLPKVVQDAIMSADVSKHLRDLAQAHQLHLDQWGILENEVQMTLMGLHGSADLKQNIKSALSLDDAAAEGLANDIYDGVFEPIREELERQLESKSAASPGETAPVAQPTTNTPLVTPAVPIAPLPKPPEAKAERAAIAPTYTAAASHERKTVEGDPYREQLI